MTHLKLLQAYLKISALLISLFSSFYLEASPSLQEAKAIGITQIVDHPSLNVIREGILDQLAQEGYKEGENLTVTFENAQGNPSVAAQISQKFASLPLDVIIPISTPSAQSMVRQIKETPIVFAAISDPLGAKVVSSFDHPGGNVTGVADTPPLNEQLDFIKKCLPRLKTLGIVYNPGEANNVTMIEELKLLAPKKHIKVVTVVSPKSADVQAASQSLIGQVEAIFVGNDNTVVSGLEALVKVCLENKIPLFVSDPDSVDRGALAAYAYDQRNMGRQVGKMVARVLRGETPGKMPVERAKDLKFSLNPKTAEKINVTCTMTH